MRLRDLLENTYTLTENERVLVDTTNDMLTEEEISQKFDIIKKAIKAITGLTKITAGTASVNDGYNISVESDKCPSTKKIPLETSLKVCIEAFIDKIKKVYPNFTYSIIDDTISMIPLRVGL